MFCIHLPCLLKRHYRQDIFVSIETCDKTHRLQTSNRLLQAHRLSKWLLSHLLSHLLSSHLLSLQEFIYFYGDAVWLLINQHASIKEFCLFQISWNGFSSLSPINFFTTHHYYILCNSCKNHVCGCAKGWKLSKRNELTEAKSAQLVFFRLW